MLKVYCISWHNVLILLLNCHCTNFKTEVTEWGEKKHNNCTVYFCLGAAVTVIYIYYNVYTKQTLWGPYSNAQQSNNNKNNEESFVWPILGEGLVIWYFDATTYLFPRCTFFAAKVPVSRSAAVSDCARKYHEFYVLWILKDINAASCEL